MTRPPSWTGVGRGPRDRHNGLEIEKTMVVNDGTWVRRARARMMGLGSQQLILRGRCVGCVAMFRCTFISAE